MFDAPLATARGGVATVVTQVLALSCGAQSAALGGGGLRGLAAPGGTTTSSDAMVPPGTGIVVDVGAGRGDVALPAAAACCKVLAVEPELAPAAALQGTTRAAGWEPWIAVLHGRVAAHGAAPADGQSAAAQYALDDFFPAVGGATVALLRVAAPTNPLTVLQSASNLVAAGRIRFMTLQVPVEGTPEGWQLWSDTLAAATVSPETEPPLPPPRAYLIHAHHAACAGPFPPALWRPLHTALVSAASGNATATLFIVHDPPLLYTPACDPAGSVLMTSHSRS